MPLFMGTGQMAAPVLMGPSTRPSTGLVPWGSVRLPDSSVGKHLGDCDCSVGGPCIWASVQRAADPGGPHLQPVSRLRPQDPALSPACSSAALDTGALRPARVPAALGAHTECGPSSSSSLPASLSPAALPAQVPAPPPVGGWQVGPGRHHARPRLWAQLRNVRLFHGRLFLSVSAHQACAPSLSASLVSVQRASLFLARGSVCGFVCPGSQPGSHCFEPFTTCGQRTALSLPCS